MPKSFEPDTNLCMQTMKATADKTVHFQPTAAPVDATALEKQNASHPLMRGIKPEHLKVLAACAMPAEFKQGELIFREGDPANRFYLIRSGRVELEAEVKERDRMLIQTIGPGDVLGWSWLFPPYYWRFDARAATSVKAIFFYGTRL